MLKITTVEVKEYLGIDYEDVATSNRLQRLIKVAHRYLIGAIGENYPANDERTKEIALIIISDLYDNHDLMEKVSGNVRRLVNDFSMQLKLELRRGSINGI